MTTAKFKTNTIIQENKDLSKYGKDFQIKFLSLLIKDKPFSFSILPIVKDVYFSDVYLRTIFICIQNYIEEHHTTPSIENLKVTLNLLGEKISVYENLLEIIDTISLEDRDFVIKHSRAFCFTKHALNENESLVNLIKEGNFEKAKKIAIETFQYSGNETTKILDLKSDLDKVKKVLALRTPIPTMFKTFNENSQGGISAGEICIVIAPSNFGKCFRKNTKIRMADYSLKYIQDIKVGEKVLGFDGLPRTVAHTTSGTDEMYKIVQKTGMNYVVNKAHILALQSKNNEEINIEVKDYLLKDNEWKENVKGYKASLEFEDEDILVDPYFLGLWLADGTHSVPANDKEVVSYLEELFEKNNLDIKKYKQYFKAKPLHWNLIREEGDFNVIGENLSKLDLTVKKSIPNNYLFSSSETRLQLLAGIIDSDGHLETNSKNTFEIIQKNRPLAWDIYLLCSSLGFKTKFSEKTNYFKINFSGETQTIPTKIIAKQSTERKKKHETVYSDIEVLPVGKGEYYGFSIEEEDKKFLLEDFTVVHNSQWLVAEARHLNVLKKNVVFFSYEMEAEPLMQKYMAGLLDVPQNLVFSNYSKEVEERLKDESLGELKIITDKAANATLANIKMQIEYLKSTGFFPHCAIIDGLNQLKLPPGVRARDDNEKFEILTEEAKDLFKELGIPAYLCWQTNRSGFDATINGVNSIGKAIEIFQKADQIITFGQNPHMQETLECIAFLLKNRLGAKHLALLCHYDPAKVLFLEKHLVDQKVLLNDEEKTKISTTAKNFKEKLKMGEYLPKKS